MFVDFGVLTLNAGSYPSAHISIDAWPHVMSSDELMCSSNPRVR